MLHSGHIFDVCHGELGNLAGKQAALQYLRNIFVRNDDAALAIHDGCRYDNNESEEDSQRAEADDGTICCCRRKYLWQKKYGEAECE